MHIWTVPAHQQGVKLIAFLQQQVAGVSARALKRALESNVCRRNGRIERFASILLSGGDRIEFFSDWQEKIEPITVPKVLYEDSYLLVIDKPAGCVCDGTPFPGLHLVHRLDRETTGVLLLAKTESSRDGLMSLFSMRKVEKNYLALVDGVPLEEEGVCETRFAKKRFFEGQTIWGSAPTGLLAKTYWKRLRTFSTAALMLCKPVTGRTHQIRVHLSEIGHPLLVDRQYADSFQTKMFIRRPLLHASRIRFTPSYLRQPITVDAPLPEDFSAVLASL